MPLLSRIDRLLWARPLAASVSSASNETERPGSTLCSTGPAPSTARLCPPPGRLRPNGRGGTKPRRAYGDPQTGVASPLAMADPKPQRCWRDPSPMLQPTHLLRALAQLGRCFDQRTAPVSMRRFDQIRFAGLQQTFTSVLADCLQQSEAVLLHAFYDHNQRLVDQPPEQVQNVFGLTRASEQTAVAASTVQLPAKLPGVAAARAPLLQKVITPVDRALQCLLPRQDGPPATTE